MKPPWNVKEVQCLIGRLATLNKFISCLGERTLSLFKTLRHITNFKWIKDYQRAFKKLKIYLSSPQILSQPRKKEDLFLYPTVSKIVVSLVLVREDEGIQRPVYYSNWTLHDVEIRYLKVEKVALALVRASRKLKPYFQAHQMVVLIDQLLRQILHKPELSRCLLNRQ
jgi:hypothetical protein